jgi:hypothetical protein
MEDVVKFVFGVSGESVAAAPSSYICPHFDDDLVVLLI